MGEQIISYIINNFNQKLEIETNTNCKKLLARKYGVKIKNIRFIGYIGIYLIYILLVLYTIIG